MKKILLPILLIFSLLITVITIFPNTEKDVVIKVIDGDTIILESGKRVRLLGIDAPERWENCYREAREELEKLVLGKEVILEKDVENTDRYGRLLRYVFINDTFVNSIMLEKGLAVLYYVEPNKKYLKQLAEAERKGKNIKGCVWIFESS